MNKGIGLVRRDIFQAGFSRIVERGWLDITGAAASWLCAIHCLVLPFFITLLPFAGLSFLLDETTERIFIGISATLAGLSLFPDYFKHHRKLRTVIFGVSGLGLIIATHLLFDENLTLKTAFLLSGAVLISAAHLINRRLCKDCAACGDHQGNEIS